MLRINSKNLSKDAAELMLAESLLVHSGDKCSCCNKNLQQDLFPDLHSELNSVKSRIDEINNQSLWDTKKKLANPYEMISSNYRKGGVKVTFKPLSRAYFKLWEIIKDYNLFPEELDRTKLAIGCLAEGPGGFMEAILHSRPPGAGDSIVGITLPVEEGIDSRTPGWERMIKNIDPAFTITYGNLYNLLDILKFSKNFADKKAWLVTADGGLDFSGDYNEQEKVATKLIFAECVTAFTIQQLGGCFVCKIFDMFSIVTVKLLYIVASFYEEMHICKPKVSRPANSEKYLVAKGFKGISADTLHKLYELLVLWNDDVVDIAGISAEKQFVYSLKIYNRKFIKEQIANINRTLQFIEEPLDRREFREVLEQQTATAVEWCRKYGIEHKVF